MPGMKFRDLVKQTMSLKAQRKAHVLARLDLAALARKEKKKRTK